MLTTGASSGLQQLLTKFTSDIIVTDPTTLAAVNVDHRQLYQGKALALALPRSVADVTEIMRHCSELRLAVVPQGGNTGYCGAATPDDSGEQLVLSLRRMNKIRNIDAANYSMIAEAGCILAAVQKAAADVERLFPLSLGSEGSCQIGGNLATNAGGLNVLRYGMMRELVLGLEVVLPDGRLLSTLTALRKDNTGYDLRHLFIGAEGTLGVITAASLRLFPAPKSIATAFVALPDPQAAVALLAQLRSDSGDLLSSFELIPQIGLDLLSQHIEGARTPLATASPWYVLCEISSPRASEALNDQLESALAAALQSGLITDAAIAQNTRERLAFWHLRESIPEAQRRAGASLKHDVAVPISLLPEFIARASAWVVQHVPEGKLVCYGHVGDGNLHFNINQCANTPAGALQRREAEIKRAIHDLVRDLKGSFSAEHGIGQLKVGELQHYTSVTELALMQSIKGIFDPQGIMNPGKVLHGP